MKIVYSTDQNYYKHCTASILSLLENNKNEKNIEIFVITNNVLDDSKNKIKNIVEKYKREVNFIEIDSLCDKFEKNNQFPLSAFARLFLENLIEINKILYIDCDTIIKGELRDLWDINIDDYYIAGVQDSIQMYARTILGLDKNDKYLNSGVLLINLKKWREDNLKQRFLEYMEKYNWNVPHNDQGVLNGVCKGKILFISPKYNLMPELLIMSSKQIKRLYKIKDYYSDEVLKDANQDIRIIHYLYKFYNRPWNKSSTHPLKDEYIKYLSMAGFSTNFTEENVKPQIELQRKLFEKLNFYVFLMIERLLDVRRKIKCNKRYRTNIRR